MQELLLTLLQAVIAAAVPILTAFAARFLHAKAEHAKIAAENDTAERYITEIADAVTSAVLHTAQTYADGLKASGTFTLDNQREALNKSVTQARALLTADASRFLEAAYGDVTKFLTAKVEAEVKQVKLLQ